MYRRLISALLGVVVPVMLLAANSPYVGQEHRDIKAMSAEEIEGYIQGRGMGLAKSAELNHYPGPKHVLELASELGLTTEQRQQTETVFQNMSKAAKVLGQELVEKERMLDQHFSQGTVNGEILKNLLTDIANLQGKLRYAHLQAHLQQKVILTAEQIQQYDQLRGYGSGHHHTMSH